MMNADAAAQMHETAFYQAYVSVAPRPEDWPVLVTKVGKMVRTDGGPSAYDWTEGVKSVKMPTLLIVGDADSLLPEHTEALFRLLGGRVVGDLQPLPSAQLAVLPGTGHTELMWGVSICCSPLCRHSSTRHCRKHRKLRHGLPRHFQRRGDADRQPEE
jgi:pimeloyl-ACP methyl ester carboxylesterase